MRVEKKMEKNLRKVELMVRRASKEGAHIVVLPEYCLYVLLEKETMKKYHNLVKKIQYLAIKYSIHIVFSHAQYVNKKFYNVSFLISEKGKIIGSHRKIFVTPEERACGIERGNKIKVFKTGFGKIAIPICWDAFSDRSAEFMRMLQSCGAEFMLVPSYSMKHSELSIKYFRHVLASNCLKNYFFVACASNIGNAIGIKSYGHSLIISPARGIIREGSENREEMLVADLDTKTLGKLEKWDKKYYKATEEAYRLIKRLAS